MTSIPIRVDLSTPVSVRIRAALNAGEGRLLNLSAGGAYIATPMLLLPQAQVRLQVLFPATDRWVEAEAVVTWENRGDVLRRGLPPGYGVRFLKVPDETAEAIREVMGFASPPAEAETQAFPVAELPLETTVPVSGGPPYRLQEEVIWSRVPEAEPGIFVLSYDGTQEARTGRADESLRVSLSRLVGDYAYFYFEVIKEPKERFFRECELYHRLGGDHGQLDNEEHPVAPTGADLTCPICDER
ncbi:MAG: PilZ domain-containing protein [Acidobacteriota bacterium]